MATSVLADSFISSDRLLGPLILAAAACTLSAEVTNISDRIRADRAIPDYVAGAIVRLVRINGPAARAGLQVGDVIQAVDDQLIQNVCGVNREISRHACNEVALTVRRGNATMVIPVRLSPPPKEGPHFDDDTACKNGVPSACTALGKTHRQIDLFGHACDLGDGEGCYLFAVNAGEDNPRARDGYRQACDSGNSLACTNLGWMLQFGKGGAADLAESARLYRRGCEGSSCVGPNNRGCLNVGRMLREGGGVDRNDVEATRLFRAVCDRSPLDDEDAKDVAHGCSLAGTAYLLGQGVAKDRPRAIALLEKGCAAADTFGCFNLGAAFEGDDNARAAGYYDKACKAGDREACERAAKLRK
jgi:hypothetical protein